MEKIVGKFKYADGKLSGPESYMLEQGNKKLDSVLAGNDALFNQSAHYSPDLITAILVWMQTDYAAWKGYKEVESWAR